MHRCNICRVESPDAEQTTVRSNVRKFRSEEFAIWRCPACQSIHARDEVDLAYYYADYPFHRLADSKVDWMLRAMYKKQLSRLQAAGLKKEHSLLDFGCGDGLFLRFLSESGFTNARGFDEYSKHFADRSALDQRYDFILSQDVLEHVPEPWDFLHQMQGLVKPGGVVALGTPNAQAMDLAHTERYVHALHAPYHRHIFSERMLLSMGGELGWELVKYHPTMYTNTFWPLINQRFLTHYFSAFDDTVDLALEPIKINSWKLWTPLTLFYALFGGFIAPHTDVMVLYRAAE